MRPTAASQRSASAVCRTVRRRRLARALLLASLAPAAAAQIAPGLVERSFTLEHQPAAEAILLVVPLLTERGAVELQPGGNTLVLRDTPAVVERAVRLLEDFDHPAGGLRLRIQLVRAGLDGDGEQGERLPDALARRLRELLRYNSYRLLAGAAVDVAEGEEVAHALGDEYEIEFRMGTLRSDRRIKLHGFRVARRTGEGDAEPSQLIHTNLNLWLDKPMILGLARAESSEQALMVVLTASRGGSEP